MLPNNTPLTQMQTGMNRMNQLKNQAVQTPVGSISESPVIQNAGSPPPASQPSATKAPGLATPPKKKLPIKVIGGALLLLLILGGSGVGLYLSTQNQDVRQQASTPTGTAVLSLTPPSTTFVANSEHSVELKVNMGVAQINIDGIQFIAELTGDIPNDIEFEPANIPGLNPIATTLIDTSAGKKLTVAFVTTPPTPFTATNQDILVGKLTFTAPSSGSMAISFDPTASKILQNATSDDVLRTPPSQIVYTFAGVGGGAQTSPTVTPPNTSTATGSATVATGSATIATESATVATGSASTATGSASTATSSSTLSQTGGGTIPTSTPTKTPTTTPTATVDPQEGRESTTLTGDTDQPVSGSVHITLIFLIIGFLSIASGTYLLKNDSDTV